MIGEKQSPLVSVLMTAYNREKYIAEAIESVIASTYQNWELIVVDDQSKDRTVEIAKSYETKDNRIKVYINEVNLGDYPNRMQAVSYATGKYIKFLDSDDYIYTHGLDVMVRAMESFPVAKIGFHDFLYNGKKRLPYQLSSNEAYYKHFFQGSLLIQGPSAAIYDKEFFMQIGGFDIEYGVATDGAFNLKAASIAPVVIFNRDLFWWRPHEGQEFKKLQEKYENLNDQLNSILLKHQNCPLDSKHAAIAYLNLKNILARKIIKNFLKLQIRVGILKKQKYSLNITQILLSAFPSRFRRLIQEQKLT